MAELPIHTAAGLLRRLPRPSREDTLAGLTDGARAGIVRLLEFPSGSAGALADPGVPVLSGRATVGDAVATLRGTGGEAPLFVFVLTDTAGVAGALSVAKLAVARRDTGITELGLDPVRTVPATVPVASLTREHWNRGRMLAVTDSSGTFVGGLTDSGLPDAARRGASRPAMDIVASLSEMYWLSLCWMASGLGGRVLEAASPGGAKGRDD